MNKQAITFLSLFSLILVLSVYYMLLPERDGSVMKQSSTIEQLQEELNEKREQMNLENQEVIAKETSTNESIKQALTSIKANEDASKVENEVNALLKELGYSEVFSEVEEDVIHITVVKKEGDGTDASLIIKSVIEKIGDNYQVQVEFIQQ